MVHLINEEGNVAQATSKRQQWVPTIKLCAIRARLFPQAPAVNPLQTALVALHCFPAIPGFCLPNLLALYRGGLLPGLNNYRSGASNWGWTSILERCWGATLKSRVKVYPDRSELLGNFSDLNFSEKRL